MRSSRLTNVFLSLSQCVPSLPVPYTCIHVYVASVYRTFPLNEIKTGGMRPGRGLGSHGQLMPPIPSHAHPHPHPPVRPSDSELALQKLASLDVSNKGIHVLMRDERRKEKRSKQGPINNMAIFH